MGSGIDLDLMILKSMYSLILRQNLSICFQFYSLMIIAPSSSEKMMVLGLILCR